MTTIKIPAEKLLEEVLYSSERVVCDRICGHRRWSVDHELIFRWEDKLYMTHYSRGATESQDEGPWDYTPMVECIEVKPQEKTVIEYVPIQDGL